jgi:hypothetical protein
MQSFLIFSFGHQVYFMVQYDENNAIKAAIKLNILMLKIHIQNQNCLNELTRSKLSRFQKKSFF